MPANWKRFLLLRMPLALAAILLVGQAAAMALRHVPLRRSYMDDLALAVERDHTPHRVVLLGDSITLMSTRRFQLGRGPEDVANLATIAWTGAAAELFLLERYLRSHPAPNYVVYAAAADDLRNVDSPQLIHYYDWNVYTKAAERTFLRHYVPGIDASENRPAVLDVQENILERLMSLTIRSPPLMPSAERPPDPDVHTEPASDNRMSDTIEEQRIRKRLGIGALEKAVFRRICQLSEQYRFQFVVVWPPIPQPVRQAWGEAGELDQLDAQVRSILANGCNAGPLLDINTLRTYTNFNRDGFHLHGAGWEERYAADLSGLIAALPDRQVTGKSTAQASSNYSGLVYGP